MRKVSKGELKDITAESLIISRTKEDIFTIIIDLRCNSHITDDQIVNAINKIPVEVYRELLDIADDMSSYEKEVEKIINRIQNLL